MAREATGVTDLGRRISAAAVLVGLDQEDVAQLLGISVRTLRRALTGKRDFSDREIGLLREQLGVPDWFLRGGFEGRPAEATDGELRDLLARQHDELVGRLDQIAEELRVVRASSPERTTR